jgi:hypothetical protein
MFIKFDDSRLAEAWKLAWLRQINCRKLSNRLYQCDSYSCREREHTISIDEEAGTLHCTCPANFHGQVCSHVALVLSDYLPGYITRWEVALSKVYFERRAAALRGEATRAEMKKAVEAYRRAQEIKAARAEAERQGAAEYACTF